LANDFLGAVRKVQFFSRCMRHFSLTTLLGYGI
jgi:hypothetical protein